MDVKNILTYTSSIGIFTYLFYYLPDAKILIFSEYMLYVIFFSFMLVYYFFTKKDIEISKELFSWVLFYFFVNALYLLNVGFGSREYQYFPVIVMIIFVFLFLSLLYNLDDNELLKTRKSITVSIIIGVCFLIIDFLIPGTFHSHFEHVAGRAAATYGNSNIAAIALVLGLILTIDIIPKNLKIYYILVVFLGILVTFSRGGIIAFLLIVSLMTFQGKVSKIIFFTTIMSIISFLTFLLLGGFDLLAATFDIKITDNLIDRVSFFVDNDSSNTQDMNERKEVLYAGLELFANSPFFGDGFASTRLWDYRVSPHNTYVVLLAEFGLIGGLIIPLLLFSSTQQIFKNTKKEHKDTALLFIVYFLLFSTVSHNMLDYSFNIAGTVILATLGYKNRQDKRIKL